MRRSPYAPRLGHRDENEQEFRDAIADAGWLSQPIYVTDWPDLIVMKGGRMHLVELKNREARGAVKIGQAAVHRLCRLFGIEIIVCFDAMEFLRAVGDLT